jgi:hypothetical protein
MLLKLAWIDFSNESPKPLVGFEFKTIRDKRCEVKDLNHSATHAN